MGAVVAAVELAAVTASVEAVAADELSTTTAAALVGWLAPNAWSMLENETVYD